MKRIQKNPQKNCIDKISFNNQETKDKKRGKPDGSKRTKRNGFIS